MSKTTRIDEMRRHLDKMDGRAKGDSSLYRHFMSKSKSKDESGKEIIGTPSYLISDGYGDVIKGLDEDSHQYVTLSLFSSPTSRKKRDIKATSGLYVDLDDSLFGGKIGLDLIHYSLTKAKLPEPSLTIHTGGGWHLYWLFNEIYYFNNREDIRRYEAIIDDITDSLSIIGADSKAKGSNRLLRLAGTVNHKYASCPAVSIIESRDVYYTIEEFEDIRVVNKLLKEYDSPVKQEVIKQSLTTDEPAANTASSKQSRVINKQLTRPEEEFPLHLLGDIIADSQDELERRHPHARFMEDKNKSIIIDLLLNYINLPRNHYTFEDGSSGQYVLEGTRNHFIWILARRGVSDKHLSVINRTLLLPSLGHSEFINALKVGRTLRVPKISSIIRDLSLTLSEQSTMAVLKVNYGESLDKLEKFINTRINQLLTESHRQYIHANPNMSAKELSEVLEISVSRVYQLRNEKGGDFMSKVQRNQEVREMFIDIDKTGRVALEEVYEHYIRAGQEIDSIIHKQGLIHSLRVQLTDQQKEDLMFLAESLINKIEVLTDQLESYDEFIKDDSEYFKSGKIKKTVLLEKVNRLKASTGRLVTV